MKSEAIVINEMDNVGVALRDIQKGERVIVGIGNEKKELLISDFVPFGHKFTVRPLKMGEAVLKYGVVIGRAICAIPAGAHAHTQNIESLRGRGDLKGGKG
jgi:altronate dehydratase small subunit